MKIETFFATAFKFAGFPATDTAPVIEVSKAEMSEIKSYLGKNNISMNVVSDQELNFEYGKRNFQVIENENGEDKGVDDRIIDAPKKDAKLSKEEQKQVEERTDNFEIPLSKPNSAANQAFAARENSKILTPKVEAANEKKESSKPKEEKVAKAIGK